jgi:murein DD-endopeptidase MepM/ murein hydrolase activator NlpD
MAIFENGTVKVQKGDTLSAIAAKAKTTVSAIAKANNITNVNLIRPGQVFNIPTKKTGGTADGKPAGTPDAPASGGGLTAEQILEQERANAAAIEAAKNKKQQVDSIAAITALLSSYGIGDLSSAITDAVVKGYSSDTINLMMQDPKGTDPLAVAFQTRFPANKARLAAGKPVLSAGEYLAAERSYSQVLQSYGVSSLATKAKMNAFITNDISAAEVSDRVGLAITRVQNADADTKAALALYYPMLNQTDIVGAVLDPAEGLPALQRKVQIAEIGGAALAQGLKTLDANKNLSTINIKMGQETLANLGVTKEQARAGFQQVAEVTPRADFLSSISTGEDYGQLQAEQEAFQGLASAKRARVALTEQEKARFGGSSGTSKSSLSQTSRGAY